MDVKLTRTNSYDLDFQKLVSLLDQELLNMYGEEMDFYSPHNKLDGSGNCIVLYLDNTPAACGAIKEYESGIAEVKRMFVNKQYRGLGFSSKVLEGLEIWADELGYTSVILETGELQHAAMGLYKKLGYAVTENYGQYVNAPSSICFAKQL